MNLPSVMILNDTVRVEFAKILNYDLSKAFRLFTSITASVDANDEKALFEKLLSSDHYEKIRDILFSGCIVDKIGVLNTKNAFEKFCDAYGLMAEAELLMQAVSHFLAAQAKAKDESDNTK